MANAQIPDLPSAISLDGTEQLEIVQPAGSGGTSKRTTTGDIAALATQGALDGEYVLVSQDGALPNGRTLAVAASLSLQDNGAGQPITIGTKAITGDVTIGVDGTVSTLGNTAVTPGSYTNASITVSAQGRITKASSGTAPVTGITAGTGIDVSGSGTVTVSLQTPVTAAHGGTGAASLAAHALLVGNGTSAVATVPAVAAGYVLASQGASSDPAYTADPVLGVAGSVGGSLTLAGESSGTIVIQPPAVAGNWTLTLPGNDGTSGQVLTTDGSGTSAWTFVPGTGTVTSIDVSGGTTGLTTTGGPVTVAGTITLDGILAGANGGTGVANTGKTITLGGNLTTSGASALTLTTTGATNVTLPTSGTLATTASPSASIVVGTTTVTGGTDTRVLYDKAGTLGEYTVSGSGNVAMTTSPAFTTPDLGTPSSGTLTNATGLPVSTGLTGAGTGVLTALGVNVGTAGSVVVNGGALGTPSSGTLTNATGLPISTGVSGLGTGVATFLATPSSANLASAVTDETGSGALVFATSPTLVTPALGTPSSGTLTNATGLPISTGVSGLGTGVATALGVNTGSAGAVVLFNGAGGTPSSLTLTNATGLPISTGVSGLGTGVATFLATPSSANLAAAVTDETGSGALVFGTTPTIATPVLNGTPTGTGVATAATASTLALRDSSANLLANVLLSAYATTATAAGTTTLTVTSAQQQYFTGSTTQTVVLPVTSTLSLGFAYRIVNNSTGAVTVQSSGANSIYVLAGSTEATFTCILTSGTSAASWDYKVTDNAAASGKKLTVSNTLTFTGTDSSSVAFGAGGTVLYSGGALGTPSSGTLTNATGLPIDGGTVNTLPVNRGGTGQVTLTNHGLIVGAGTTAVTQLAVASTGTMLQGATGADPAFSATPTLGNATTTGIVNLAGKTSGTVSLSVADAAGTWTMKLPTSAGSNTNVLQTDGSGNTSWVAVSGSGTVNSGTAGQMAYYASSTTAVSGNANATISNGALTLGVATSVIGTLGLSGNTSGVVTIKPQAAAGTYNFNLPTTAGASGDLLTSGGGVGAAMTWLTPGTGVATFLATPSSANLASAVTDGTGSGALVFGTTPTIATPVLNGTPTGTGVATAATASTLALRDSSANLLANALLSNYTTTATAAGTTTLTVTSSQQQYFTGSTTQTVKLPVTSTLSLGFTYTIVNNSTGAVTVQSSGANTIYILAGSTEATFTCILTSGTGTASWDYKVVDNALASGKKLTVSNTLTLTGTDGSSVAFGAGGTVLYNGGALGTPSSGTLTNCTGLPVAGGGTGAATLGAGGLLAGNGTSAVQVLSTGTAGFALNAAGGTAIPTWNNNGIRAHILFNGTGTPAVRGTAYNVTSITDNGVGDWTLNFTSALPSANYTVTGSASDDGSVGCGIGIRSATAPTTSALRLLCFNTSGSAADVSYAGIGCIGG